MQLTMMYHQGIPPGNASTTPAVRRIAFRNISATDVADHAGFCMPLGAVPRGQPLLLVDPPSPGLMALFQGLPESPLENILLQDVQLSGPRSAACAVQCTNATVTSSNVKIDRQPTQIECDNVELART